MIAKSYEFALVSTAAAVAIDGRTIQSARLAMGGVAHSSYGGSARRRSAASRACHWTMNLA